MKRVIWPVVVLIGMFCVQSKMHANPALIQTILKTAVVPTSRSLSTVPRRIKVANIDTGGVRGDNCCRQPVQAFEAAVESLNICKEDVQDLIYGKMGMSKRPHLEEILFSEKGIELFTQINHRYPIEEDIESAYEVFLEVQRSLLLEDYPIIPGCAEAEDAMRKMDITLIGTTGYDRELRDLTNIWLDGQGSRLEGSITPEEAGGGRPAPWQVFAVILRAHKLRNEYVKPSEVVTIDDTPAGIEAGHNAGTWCVGIGGTSILQNQYPGDFKAVSNILLDAGAHLVVNSIVNVPDAICVINEFLKDPLVSPETFAFYLGQQIKGD